MYIVRMKHRTFADMRIKAWTPDQVRDLVVRAKEAGVTQQELSEHYIGCTLGALGHWMTGRDGRRPNDVTRRALAVADEHITMGLGRPLVDPVPLEEK